MFIVYTVFLIVFIIAFRVIVIAHSERLHLARSE
jgi:hypothetical protein